MNDRPGDDLPEATFSHFAVCTSDLERSTRFYAQALGCSVEKQLEIGAPFDRLTEVEGLEARTVFMLNGGVTIELLGYTMPGVIGPAERRPMNQLGITHMAFTIADLEKTAAKIDELGGTALRETLVSGPMGEMMFAVDPDGTRLELWQKPANAAG